MPRLRPPSKEDSLLLPDYPELPPACIFIPATDAEFAAARSALLSHKALGFDTESKPLFHTHQVDTGPHLVQLATPQAAWLLQLHHPQAVALAREVLAHPQICKVGFGLDNDKSTLPQRLGTALANVVDLDSIFKRHGYGASTGVRAAVALVLGQNFQKSKKQSTSNWASTHLSPAQVRYAANDAHAPAMVYAALANWEAQQPAVPVRSARPPRVRAVEISANSVKRSDLFSDVPHNECVHANPTPTQSGDCNAAASKFSSEKQESHVSPDPVAISASSPSRPYNPKRAALLQAPRK